MSLLAGVTEPAAGTRVKRLLLRNLCRAVDADHWSMQLMTSAEGSISADPAVLAGGPGDEIVVNPEDKAAVSGLASEMFAPRGNRPIGEISSRPQPSVRWLEREDPPLILTARSFDIERVSLIAFSRHRGRSAFSYRECRAARILLTEVPWLHHTKPQEVDPVVKRLSPGRRRVLDQLLAGRPRKQIASELQLSPNTVSSYVKEIYAAFGVHSQIELIRRIEQGGQS